ncbi:hypothetical protein GQ472_00660 [archaeon]|nr:hypothetical protein [archaeon]
MATEDVTLENTGVVEGKSIDISPYVGKMTKIEAVTEHKGEFGYFIKVVSDVLGKEGDIELRASALFNLTTDKDDESKIGWTEKSKLTPLLKRMKVEHYNDLVGKELQVTKATDKNGMEWLTF